MNQAAKLIGALAKIAIEGTAYTLPGAGTVSRTNCPPNDAANAGPISIWADIGIIENASEKTDSTKIEIYRPSPGVLQLDDELETKFKRTIALKITECSNVMWLLLNKALSSTSPLTGAIGQYVPFTHPNTKAWFKAQKYDGQTNALLFAEQTWCKLSIDNAVEYGGDKQMMFDLTVKQLWSPLNSHTGN